MNTNPSTDADPASSQGPISRLIAAPCIGLIRLYQMTLSHLIGGHCRFQPTCSHYALEAFRTLNPIRAAWLTARRLARCHPLGGSGFDPPPSPKRSRDIPSSQRPAKS